MVARVDRHAAQLHVVVGGGARARLVGPRRDGDDVARVVGQAEVGGGRVVVAAEPDVGGRSPCAQDRARRRSYVWSVDSSTTLIPIPEALVDRDDPVGDGRGLAVVVGHEQGRGGSQRAQDAGDLDSEAIVELPIQPGQRFVEEQRLRRRSDRSGEGGTRFASPPLRSVTGRAP